MKSQGKGERGNAVWLRWSKRGEIQIYLERLGSQTVRRHPNELFSVINIISISSWSGGFKCSFYFALEKLNSGYKSV